MTVGGGVSNRRGKVVKRGVKRRHGKINFECPFLVVLSKRGKDEQSVKITADIVKEKASKNERKLENDSIIKLKREKGKKK
jgi:hypothetical protein